MGVQGRSSAWHVGVWGVQLRRCTRESEGGAVHSAEASRESNGGGMQGTHVSRESEGGVC